MIVFAVLLIIVGVLNWQANSRLEQQIGEIRAAGEPVTLVDLQGEPVPPDENAVTYLQRVDRQVLAINKELETILNNDGPHRDSGKLNEGGARLVRATPRAYASSFRSRQKCSASRSKTQLSRLAFRKPAMLAVA
jgi:HAMP domain-containing protein